jgi:hypothetical protein
MYFHPAARLPDGRQAAGLSNGVKLFTVIKDICSSGSTNYQTEINITIFFWIIVLFYFII